MREEAAEQLRLFYEVIERLRAPGGCPWDREQTHQTLAPYLLEETYELLEAINSGDEASLREELGDVLLQVFIHCAIAAEKEGGFDIGDVAEQVRLKMIHRHPHVFGDVEVTGAADVVVNWEKLKSVEKKSRESLLDGVPKTLPALAYAQAIQKRPARLGLDSWHELNAAVAGVENALQRIQAAAKDVPAPQTGEDWVVREGEIARGAGAGSEQVAQPSEEIATAVGELLWSAAALTRMLRVDGEDELRRRTDEFARRFRATESELKGAGLDIHELSDDQREKLRKQTY
jgi:nucleoside triphosphate diphosphatase